MEMNITSTWATKLLSLVLNKMLKNRLGNDVRVQINNVSIKAHESDKVQVHLDVDAAMTKEYLQNVLLNS